MNTLASRKTWFASTKQTLNYNGTVTASHAIVIVKAAAECQVVCAN